MPNAGERFPLIEAYEFARGRGMARQTDAIQTTKVDWRGKYAKGVYIPAVHRGEMIMLLEGRGLLEDFIEQCWPYGKSLPGQKEIKACVRKAQEYRELSSR